MNWTASIRSVSSHSVLCSSLTIVVCLNALDANRYLLLVVVDWALVLVSPPCPVVAAYHLGILSNEQTHYIAPFPGLLLSDTKSSFLW